MTCAHYLIYPKRETTDGRNHHVCRVQDGVLYTRKMCKKCGKVGWDCNDPGALMRWIDRQPMYEDKDYIKWNHAY